MLFESHVTASPFSDEKINKILNINRFDNEFRSIYLQDLEEIIKME